tara:strand:+ start:227 stop:1414 length:1188 start_codon:yes stop_codon:yes gene_type:complete
MIQGFTETTINAFISTEDNRIDTSVATTGIAYLVKFINDMDGSIQYCYPAATIYDRYTHMTFPWNPTADVFRYINLLPAGYWKYEVYEVSWIGSRIISSGYAPITETDVLEPASNDKGVVQGLVTKGKLNLTERTGTEQVQYTQHEEPSATNYIYYGDPFLPSDLSNFSYWYAKNLNITADEDSTGAALSPDHTSNAETMVNGDRINGWNATVGTYNAAQTTSADKPSWDSTQLGTVDFATGTFMDLGGTITEAGLFTIYTRVYLNGTSNKAFLGSSSTNFFRISTSKEFRVRIGSAVNNLFTEVTDTISTGVWYTFVLQRINVAGDLRMYVEGGAYSDKAWGSITNQDTDAFTIDNIGAAADDTNTMDGNMSDILIYGSSHTAAERAKIYNYLA